jgi:hemoglobin
VSNSTPKYGVEDNSYQAAGGIEGITQLVDQFFTNMETLELAKDILDMHPKDLVLSRQKLAYFLSGWLGGPRLFAEHFGGISIPQAHSHLPVGVAERDAWLHCMALAINDQTYDAEFKTYLLAQLSVPAERIRQVCSHAQGAK